MIGFMMGVNSQSKAASEPIILDDGQVSVNETSTSKPKNSSRRTTFILIVILVLAAIFYFVQLTPQGFGSYHDDSIYVTTAKSLAEGQGYRILSLPYEPAQTKYPPFYPWLLSLIWRIYPQFPQNLTWMMMLSVVATIGFLALSYRYLVKQGYARPWQALIVVGLAAFNWRTLILATGLYSEMIYAALSVMALLLAERYEKQQLRIAAGTVLGVVLGLAMLTRSSGIALLIAIGTYYGLHRRWRNALLPVGIGTTFMIAWVVWCYFHKTTVEGVNVAYYTNYIGHFKEVVKDLQAVNHESTLMTILSIIGRNAFMLVVVSIPVVCLGIPYEWITYFGFTVLFFAAGFWRHMSKQYRLLHIYIVTYLVLHFFWLPFVAYDRFLIPLLPFLLLFLLVEVTAMSALLRREFAVNEQVSKKISAGIIALALFVIVGIVFFNYGLDLKNSLTTISLQKSAKPGVEDGEAIAWLNEHSDPTDVVVCYRDPMYFLYTGHKATRLLPMKAGLTWRDHQKLIMNIISENNANYLITTSTDFENEYQTELQRASFQSLIEQHPETFALVFEALDGRCRIYNVKNYSPFN